MSADQPPVDAAALAELAETILSGPAWEAWRRENPDLAAEVLIARRVSMLLAELQAAPIALPADFEARLLARVRRDTTLIDLLDLGLARGGRVLLELLEALFGLLPAPATAQPA